MPKILIVCMTRCVLTVLLASNLAYSVEKCSLRTENDFVNGDGLFKATLDKYANTTNIWPSIRENNTCYDEMFDLSLLKNENHPTVFLSIFIDKPTPFFDEFLDKIENIDYPKSRLVLSITTLVEYHKEQVDKFISRIGNLYNTSYAFHKTTEEMTTARHFSIMLFISNLCEYLFYVESEVHLDNPQTLKILISQNRNIIAPMLTRPFTTWSNFWGSLSKERLYAGSFDYSDIINYNKTGIWSVSHISSCYLIKSNVICDKNTSPSYEEDNLEYDTAFSKSLRDKGVFMYIDNEYNFGHLINSETFNVSLKNPEMYQLFENMHDWEQRYVHPDYKSNFDPNTKPIEICPDVFWIPIVSEQFCKELIEIADSFGRWATVNEKKNNSFGKNQTLTKDIEIIQVGLHDVWMKFLDEYITPMRKLVFEGYNLADPPRTRYSFVVKYNSTIGISAVGPHYDASTFTINIALNFHGRDYQGGGCHFLRYDCKVEDTRVGWMLMHPGPMTHFHQGIHTTNGSRYIFVTFIDPPIHRKINLQLI